MIIFISVFVSFNTFRKVEQAKEKNRMDFFHGLIHTYNEIINNTFSAKLHNCFHRFFCGIFSKTNKERKAHGIAACCITKKNLWKVQRWQEKTTTTTTNTPCVLSLIHMFKAWAVVQHKSTVFIVLVTPLQNRTDEAMEHKELYNSGKI